MGRDDEARVLIAKALDKAHQAEITADFAIGDFVDPTEAALLASVFAQRSGTAGLHLFGGYAEAERKRYVLAPNHITPEEGHYGLRVVEVRPRDPNARLIHPAVLGAVMSQGIKREKIGDIVIIDGPANIIMDAVLADSVSPASVGRDAVTCSVRGLDSLRGYTPETDSGAVTVASLRLDAVLAGVFRLSRSEASAVVSRGLVKVNHLPEDSASRNLREGDLLSLRGSGRARLARIAGETKKGRLRLEIERPKP